jgi:uncharacterized protein
VVAGFTLLVIGAVAAGVVQGISGFAFGMVAMSIWAWGIDPAEATVMAVFGGLCGQVLAAVLSRRRSVASELLPFLLGGLAGVPIGTWLLPHIGVVQFKLLLGCILTISCPLMLSVPRIRLLDSIGRVGDGAAGVAGGIIGGLSGMSGVAPAIWCTLRGYDKARQRELLQNFNLAILAATMAALVFRGAVSVAMVPRLAIVGVAMLVPSMVGARIYHRLSDASFRRIVLVLLTLSGVALVTSAISTGLAQH